MPNIRALFDGLTTLFIAQNVRPSLEDEELETAQLQLALAFDDYRANRGGGFQAVGELSRLGVLPTAQSYNLIVDYLGRTNPGGVLAVWSAAPDHKFTGRLKDAGFQVDVQTVRARPNNKGPHHTIWFAAKR